MKKFILLPFLILALSITSCKKKPSGGLGGNANLKISVFHHSLEIDSATVYIKFNATDKPTDNQYDLQQVLQKDLAGDSYAIFEGLKPGDYYVYATGWDPSIFSNVNGGIPYTIKEEADIQISVPVTEQH
ncbi:MAG: hypothetical protein JNJ58_06300 [Chitinophagaceae bacterium]|nr:hypothetical protein [Chitinophagaceae bacterium]